MKPALAVALAIAATFAWTAQATGSPPAGMSKAEYRALVLRSEALNQRYGLGVPKGMTAAEYRALVIRSEALNRKYVLGHPTRVAASVPVRPTQRVAWVRFALAAGGVLALLVVVMGTIGVRHVRRPSASSQAGTIV